MTPEQNELIRHSDIHLNEPIKKNILLRKPFRKFLSLSRSKIYTLNDDERIKIRASFQH